MNLRLFIAACVAVGACEAAPTPPADADGASLPPSQLERAALGPDANDPFFLKRFRDCAAWASYSYCEAEMYGGLTP